MRSLVCLVKHQWRWQIVQNYPLKVRQICDRKNCHAKQGILIAKLRLPRKAKCGTCLTMVDIWRTYVDGTISCLGCVVKAMEREATLRRKARGR